jgi:hypothetical protein
LKEARGTSQGFLSFFFKLTRIGHRMFRQTEANVSYNSLSASVTCEHVSAALSSTYLQSMVGARKPGEPGRSNPDTSGLATLEDLGVVVVSLRAALPEITDTCVTYQPIPEQTPSVITWPGAGPIHLDADGA